MEDNGNYGGPVAELCETVPSRRRDIGVAKALVAIASYGSGNDAYLKRMIAEYRSLPFDVDIVVLSNIDKPLGPGVETRVGLPSRNPWSLPFAHKPLFAERASAYDLFIYSEDDILIGARAIAAFLEVAPLLRDDEIAGFLRFETTPDGRRTYPDAHGRYHWDPTSIRTRGPLTLARFTNDHAACYMLTRAQLGRALASGGFAVKPHADRYDLLCTAATDPYTQCGFVKLIPISRLDDFTVHHMSNKYAGKVGVDETEMRRQLAALADIARGRRPPLRLLDAETRLPEGVYSRDFYEPAAPEILRLVPPQAARILSVGCASGATEIALARAGVAVTAAPMDPVSSRAAAEAGVEMCDADLATAPRRLAGRRFDALLMLNLLHLTPDPVAALTAFGALLAPGAPVILSCPNMASLPATLRQIRIRRLETPLGFEKSGAHFTSAGRVARWCRQAGLTLETARFIPHPRLMAYDGRIPRIAQPWLAADIIAVARRAAAEQRERA
ncbi:2-polyprenyl-3-methyl-5-hydroxy-6-metoxy-1,4-benzoquinol methylase [Rhodoblastus acidophilus]|uniref:class I SAM-dependent methyltransferase n=1 Tax=Rhodoblastus acidophilus TaxID=1074 RepID=UPI0022254450|nr:class I SAM-dependent methyltransferase [Rhodoblastus acidophilus]MCW2317842.1 2-polyprenyl-3-methyl-5-hydroxy-6-metoxy-1,4-benzoquinol methylase [Rhodoblastus acidophilus]